MSEQEFIPESHTSGPLAPSNLLTPKSTAIAGFTFAVFSMLGQGSWSSALSALLWGNSFGLGTAPKVMMVWGVGCLVMAGLAAWLAHSTLRVSDQAWEGHLARAAVLVAAVGAVLAAITIIGGLLHSV